MTPRNPFTRAERKHDGLRFDIVEQFERKLISHALAVALLMDAGMERAHAELYLKKDQHDD